MSSKRLCSIAMSALIALSMSAPAFAAPAEMEMGETNVAPVSTTDTLQETSVPTATDTKEAADDLATEPPIAEETLAVEETTKVSNELEAQAEGIDISKATVDPISVKSYTGSEIKPKPVVKYDGKTLVEGTDYTLSYSNNINETTDALCIITGTGAYTNSKTVKFEITGKGCNVIYQTHVQNVGWQGWKSNGAMSGTEGQALRLEGVQISLSDAPNTGDIEYRTHVQNIGWESKWSKNGATSGTTGRGLRLESIQIKLTGNISKEYNVWYRVHAQNVGWMGWAKNGESAGTAGYGRRLEGLEIQVLPINAPAPGSTIEPFKFAISYRTHVQNVGWQDYVCDGAMSGTEGRALRLEGIQIRVDNSPYKGKIQYKTHVQNVGWETTWRSDDEVSGTMGRGLRLEAIKIRLTDDLADNYDVYYRVHAQNVGWMGWARNESPAGTAGYGYRLEGINIKLVPRNGEAPGSTENAFMEAG